MVRWLQAAVWQEHHTVLCTCARAAHEQHQCSRNFREIFLELRKRAFARAQNMIWTVMTFRSIPTYTYICVQDHIMLGCSSLQGLQSWTQSVSAFALLFSPFRRTAPSNLEYSCSFLLSSVVLFVLFVLFSFPLVSFRFVLVTSLQPSMFFMLSTAYRFPLQLFPFMFFSFAFHWWSFHLSRHLGCLHFAFIAFHSCFPSSSSNSSVQESKEKPGWMEGLYCCLGSILQYCQYCRFIEVTKWIHRIICHFMYQAQLYWSYVKNIYK